MITPEKDVEDIHNSLISKKSDVIINIISKRTYQQINILIYIFKKTYNKDLIKEINNFLSYDVNLISIFSLLSINPINYDCQTLFIALNQSNKDINTLIEIIITRPSNILKKVIVEYSSLYKNKNIIKEIENINISRIIKNILIIFLTKEKNENKTPDLDLCQSLAIKLENEKVKNWLNINSILYNIIINNSQTEIYFISMFYKKLSGNSIIEKIDKEIIEDEKYYFIQIILSLISLEEYFTKKLYKAINDKNENIILRILITRRDIDLEKIKQCYFQLYNKTLINDIKNFFSGDSYKLISNIIGM